MRSSIRNTLFGIGALASAYIGTGCDSPETIVESNSDLVNGYDISIEQPDFEKMNGYLRIGTSRNDSGDNFREVIYAPFFNGEPRFITFNMEKDSPLRQFADLESIEDVFNEVMESNNQE